MPRRTTINPDHGIRYFFLFLLLVHACFIIYGSLVPFRFEFIPLAQAWEEFQRIIFSPPRIFSRANLLSNILIGIPGSFLFLATFLNRNSRLSTLIMFFLAVAYSALLATIAEFLQLYFSSRITTLSDIIAQTCGGAIGVLGWLLIGPYTKSVLKSLIFSSEGAIRAGTFLIWSYIGIMVLMHALPLDISAKLGSLYRQLEDGRIILIPFSTWTGSKDVLNSLPSLLAWVPIGWFLVGVRAWSPATAMLAGTLGAASLEFMQIFVLSRTTDATAILLGAAGGFSGGLTGQWTRVNLRVASPTTEAVRYLSHSKRILLGCGLFLGWFGLTIKAFWSPFIFCFDKAFLARRVRDVGLIPMQFYVGKGYLHSAFNILEVVVYFLPLGIIFSSLVTRHFKGDGARAVTVLFFVAVCLVAGLIEFGQIFIPQRYPDITDWLFMVAGAMFGHAMANMFWKNKIA
ncbi:VanZ family protein [Desulfonatronum parangueonense]